MSHIYPHLQNRRFDHQYAYLALLILCALYALSHTVSQSTEAGGCHHMKGCVCECVHNNECGGKCRGGSWGPGGGKCVDWLANDIRKDS